MPGFHGIYPAIITPMTPEGDFNEQAFRQVMEFNIQAGVHGFWVAGGTGESVFLTDEENMRIAEVSVDQNRGRTNIIMHVGAPSTKRAAMMAEHAAKAGVEAICCLPPFFYSVPDDSIAEHYRAVGAAAGLPLFAYNLPQCTGVDLTPDLMKRIQNRTPQLAGLKHSSMEFANIHAFNRLGLKCFTGMSRLMLPALTIGATGCVDGPPCAAPEPYVDIWNAFREGDMERARASQARAEEVFQTLLRFDYFGSVKAALSERLSIECGDPRPPLAAITPEQRALVRDGLKALGLGRVAVSGTDV